MKVVTKILTELEKRLETTHTPLERIEAKVDAVMAIAIWNRELLLRVGRGERSGKKLSTPRPLRKR